MRRSFVAGNWKMNKSPKETREFLKSFHPSTQKEVVIFVPALVLSAALDVVAAGSAATGLGKSAQVKIGIQNFHFEKKGAFTGETSPEVAHSMGATWALVGHSERRSLFHETDEDTKKKVALGLECGLSIMLCVGETLSERESGRTNEVVERQLAAALGASMDWSRIAIAYEPVWAIGTGKVATPEQASETHTHIRLWLKQNFGDAVSENTSILYGGSAKPENFLEIAAKPNIDGFLIGGASLDVASLAKFCN